VTVSSTIRALDYVAVRFETSQEEETVFFGRVTGITNMYGTFEQLPLQDRNRLETVQWLRPDGSRLPLKQHNCLCYSSNIICGIRPAHGASFVTHEAAIQQLVQEHFKNTNGADLHKCAVDVRPWENSGDG